MAINVMMQVGSSLAGRELPGLFWSRSAATYLSESSPHRLVNGIAGMNVSDRGVAAPVAPSHWDRAVRMRALGRSLNRVQRPSGVCGRGPPGNACRWRRGGWAAERRNSVCLLREALDPRARPLIFW